ncbi:sensor histidine kinase [Paenibacillus thalictri]|nr:HAMP domain-containing sensor histidine kinase [Paenibacillus thalictri]
MSKGSLKRHVTVRFIAVVLVTLFLLEGVFFVAVRQFYYNSILSVLANHAKVTSSFYNKYSGEVSSTNLSFQLNTLLQQYAHPSAELQIINRDGRLLAASSGFSSDERIATGDVKLAFKAAQTEVWKGYQPGTGEHVMSVAIPLLDHGQPFVLLRYVTSLKEVDRLLLVIYAVSAGIGLAVLGIVLTLSGSLAGSIVRPIRDITAASSRMAKGEYETRVQEAGPDEVRELGRTLNYMASEIERTEKLKNDFISSVSHELRTPISGIKGWSETILTGEMQDAEETRFGLQMISKETERLIGLVEELLDFSRLSEKRIVLEWGEVELESLLREVLLQVQSKADHKRLNLICAVGQVPGKLHADGNRLRQVFLNVLDNAIKYSHPGGSIWLEAEISEASAEEDSSGAASWELATAKRGRDTGPDSGEPTKRTVTVRVRDEGIGIAADQLRHVGEKFYQVNPGAEGTGLGLAICREIMELHGGKLLIESEPGQGTMVTVALRLEPGLAL